MATLNQMPAEDYLRAEGAQMMIRRLCEWCANGNDVFYTKFEGKPKTVSCTPQQSLDAIRRFTAGVINADIFLKYDELVVCPVWGEKKGKPIIERLDIITRREYDERKLRIEI